MLQWLHTNPSYFASVNNVSQVLTGNSPSISSSSDKVMTSTEKSKSNFNSTIISNKNTTILYNRTFHKKSSEPNRTETKILKIKLF